MSWWVTRVCSVWIVGSKVPLLTKEGSGEVFDLRRSNLPLAPSFARRGLEEAQVYA